MIRELEAMTENWINDGDEQRKRFGDLSGQDIEDGVCAKLESFCEGFDDKLPAIGVFMDLPIVDQAQKSLIRIVVKAFVRRVFGRVRYNQEIARGGSPVDLT